MPHAVGEPAERHVAGDLAGEEQRREHAGLRGRRLPGAEGIDRVEAASHDAHDGKGARDQEPPEVRVAPEQRRNAPEVGPEGHGRGRRGRRWLPDQGERRVRERHARRCAQEADAEARRSRHRRQDVRREEAPGEAGGGRGEIRGREEPAAQRHRNRPAHDIHPRRHQHAPDAGDDQEQGEQHAEHERRRTLRHDERGERQHEERHALPDRVAEHEG